MHGRLVTEKQKDIEQADPIPLKFEKVQVGVDEDGDPITSLVLVETDAFEDASGQEEEREETVRDAIADPGDWTVRFAPESIERRRLLQVVAEVGGSAGLTQSEARAGVANRWYGGKVARSSKDAGVSGDVLRKAWKLFQSDGTGPDGDPLFVSAGGERMRIHPLALEVTKPSTVEQTQNGV
jgi:hypothetical protein